ncbi:MAG: heme exporter protein CcmB [Myxococcota bacterium]
MAAIATGAQSVRVIWAIIQKDLLIEWRSQARIVSLSAFAVLVLLLFSFAVGPHTESLRRHASGYLWLGVIFASTLLVQQSMRTEIESDAMTQLQLVPVSSTSLFYGKAIACFFQLLLISLVMLPPLFALCDLNLTESLGWLMLVLILGNAGIAAPGALYSAMTARMNAQQLLIPLLLYPLLVPALLSAVKSTSLILSGDPMGQLSSWVGLLICFDLVFWSVCGILYGRVIDR